MRFCLGAMPGKLLTSHVRDKWDQADLWKHALVKTFCQKPDAKLSMSVSNIDVSLQVISASAHMLHNDCL